MALQENLRQLKRKLYTRSPEATPPLIRPAVVYETVSLPWIIYRGQLTQAYREAAEHRLGHRIRGLKKRYGKERMERDMATTTYSFKGMYPSRPLVLATQGYALAAKP
jgi:hypothetical protein